MTRRNQPNINPRGAKWTNVRAVAQFDYYNQRSQGAPTRPYRAMMNQLGNYIAAGFAVTYREHFVGGELRVDAEARP